MRAIWFWTLAVWLGPLSWLTVSGVHAQSPSQSPSQSSSQSSSQALFGGPAPLPTCRVEPRYPCYPHTDVVGVQAGLQLACNRMAAGHPGPRGGMVFCGQVSSVATSCSFMSPILPDNWRRAQWANVTVIVGGQVIVPFNAGQGDIYLTWGPEGTAGLTCFCGGGSGLTNDATCACPPGMNWDEREQRCLPKPPDPMVISLLGPDHTRALPAGPVITLLASVTQGGRPVPGARVRIQQDARLPLEGTTDASGGFVFTYVPPLQTAANLTLVASCVGCTNEAVQEISVDGSQMCGDTFGNPLQPGTGEKQQDEPDWLDDSPHPLHLVRHWRSSQASIGGRSAWRHGYDARLETVGSGFRVVSGDGTSTRFARGARGWTADNSADRLAFVQEQWHYTRAIDDVTFRFDTTGRLHTMTSRNGWTMSMTYSAGGLLQRVTNAFGRHLDFTYDSVSRLASVTTPDASVIRYAYDDSGRLAQVALADDARRLYHYEDSRWPAALTGITDEAGTRQGHYRYDDVGRAIATQRAGGVDGYEVQYLEGPAVANTLIAGSQAPASAYRISAAITEPSGRVVRHAWSGGDGRIHRSQSSEPDRSSGIAQRFPGAEGLIESERDFLGVSTFFTWDATRQLPVSTTQAAGRPEARTTGVQWHSQWRLPVLVTQEGRTTAYAYDNLGNLTSEAITDTTTGQVRTRAWTWSARGLVQTHTDARGATWRYEHDALGRRTAVTDPVGDVTTYRYDAAGRLLTRTDPGGLVTAFVWDARGRLRTQSAGGQTMAFTWTPTGQLASVTRPDGSSVALRYDAAQRLVGLSDNRAGLVNLTLDAAGQVVREEVLQADGARVRDTTRQVDALGHVLATRSALGQATHFAYDANGRLVSAVNSLGMTSRQVLDALGRPTAATLVDNASVAQEWNALDFLTQVVDPRGVATTYAVNAFGDVVEQSSPDIGSVRYTHDLGGDLAQVQDAKGQVTHYERDAVGRVVRIAHADGEQVNLQYNTAGAVKTLEDASGRAAYERDALGRMVKRSQWVNDDPAWPTRFDLAYQWSEGALASITYPSGLKVAYRREAGRVTGIDIQPPGWHKVRSPFVTALAYTALGQPRSWRWANGDTASRSFDADARITATEFARYGYDLAGRIVSVSQDLRVRATDPALRTVSLAWQAGYDSRDRLVRFARDGHEVNFTYDANGNRVTSTETVVRDSDLEGDHDPQEFRLATGRVMDLEATSNRLLGLTQTLTRTQAAGASSTSTASVRYSLDANGSLTHDGLRQFEYHASGRLAQVRTFRQGQAVDVRYLHNALGQRVFQGEPQPEYAEPDEATWGSRFAKLLQRILGGLFSPVHVATRVGTAFVFGEAPLPSWSLLGEYDNGSARGRGRSEIIWLPTEDGSAIPVGMMRNGSLFAIHTDHLGTPRLITDNEAKPVWQWPYSAFGDNRPTGALVFKQPAADAKTASLALLRTTTPIEFNLRFPGQYWDQNTGLLYNYWRDYMAGQGRYAQADPIGLSGGWNRFGYGEGNPLSMTDPLGLMGGSGSGAAHRRPPPTVSAFGCIGLVCLTGGGGTPQMSAELTLGGGIEICDAPPPPPDMCPRPGFGVQPPGIPMPTGGSSGLTMRGGLFFGPSIKSDGSFCMRLGPHYTVPLTPSVDLGAAGR